MKKLLIILAITIPTNSFFLSSCGKSKTDTTMKMNDTKADSTSSVTSNYDANLVGKCDSLALVNQATPEQILQAKTATIENIQAAYKDEVTATDKYLAFSKRADEDGYHSVALLYKAVSMSEHIHAQNHRAVLVESGESVPEVKPEFSVRPTKENLVEYMKDEATKMYYDYLKTAKLSENKMAMVSIRYAQEVEFKYIILFEKTLSALENKTEKSLSKVFYVCPTCGNIFESDAPERCEISLTKKEKFVKIATKKPRLRYSDGCLI